MRSFIQPLRLILPALAIIALLAVACGSAAAPPTPQVVEKEVVVEREVIKEVPQEVVITQEVVREVPQIEVVEKEVVKEVTRDVVVEVPREVPVEVIVEVPMEPGEPVKIGTILAYTGPLAAYGPPVRNGAELAATLLNAAGGVLDGRPVEAVHKDSGSAPQTAIEAARALVNVDGVGSIVGPMGSGVTLAVAEAVTVPSSVVIVSPSATSPALTVLADNDFLFRTTAGDNDQGIVLAELARESYGTASALYVNNPYGEGLANIFKERFEAAGGQVLELVPVEEEQTSYISELRRATEGDPEVLLAITYPASAQVYIREALEGGFIDTFMFVDGTKSQEMFDALNNSQLDGLLGTAPGTDSMAKDVFTGLYEQRFGQLPENPFIAEAFDAFVLLGLAIEQAGSEEGADIKDALRTVANAPGEVVGPGDLERALQLIRDGQDINYEGAAGNQDMNETGDVFGSFEIWTVKDGQIASTGRYETP